MKNQQLVILNMSVCGKISTHCQSYEKAIQLCECENVNSGSCLLLPRQQPPCILGVAGWNLFCVVLGKVKPQVLQAVSLVARTSFERGMVRGRARRNHLVEQVACLGVALVGRPVGFEARGVFLWDL